MRIAHLSDIHFGPVPFPTPWREPTRLKQILGYINWRRSSHTHSSIVLETVVGKIAAAQPDVIVVGGDIIELGQDSEFAVGRRFLDRLRDIAPLMVTPGNHDPYSHAAGQRLLHHWAPYLPQVDRAVKDVRNLYPHCLDLGPVALIALCSGLPTWLFSAEGALGEGQLARLDALLAEVARKQQIPIIAIHHPPDRAKVSWLKRLRDGKALLSVLSYHRCLLVLHGHSHHAALRDIMLQDHAIIMAGASSASATEQAGSKAAGFTLIEFEVKPNMRQLKVEILRLKGNDVSRFDKRAIAV